MARLRVLFAPDSFKGTLSSVAVARAMADGWARARPEDELHLAPLADGGDGTLAAVAAAEPPGLTRHEVTVEDPLGRPIEAEYLTLEDGRQGAAALVELASASGLGRLAPAELEPGRASTDGTGTLLLDAIDRGVGRVVLGLGGSATTDGGSGILRRLGARLTDARGDDLPPGGLALAGIVGLDLSRLPARLWSIDIVIASDVRNPLLGPMGAAAIFGPQKGATPELVARLDAALARWADVLESTAGRPIREVTATGAAGGTLAGLMAIEDRFKSLSVRPGIDVVMELTGFAARLRESDLVVTGEGRLDMQTALGKTLWGVAQRARSAGVPCVAVVGSIDSGGRETAAGLVENVVAVSDVAGGVTEAMVGGAAAVSAAAERLARSVAPP